jgi:hypothetical protein
MILTNVYIDKYQYAMTTEAGKTIHSAVRAKYAEAARHVWAQKPVA